MSLVAFIVAIVLPTRVNTAIFRLQRTDHTLSVTDRSLCGAGVVTVLLELLVLLNVKANGCTLGFNFRNKVCAAVGHDLLSSVVVGDTSNRSILGSDA